MDEVDVVVVGAGMAGLSCAHELQRAGRAVRVLEARQRVGGRVLTQQRDGDLWLDLGGQWLAPTQTEAHALVRRLGAATFPTHATGDTLLEHDGRLTRYRGNLPRINPLILADLGQAQLRLDRMARQVPLATPWTARRAREWDGQTFETWIRRTARTRIGRELLRLSVAAVWSCEAADISLLHVLFYTHSAGGFDALIGTDGGGQQDRVIGGTGQLADGLAAELSGAVQLGAPVRAIVRAGGALRVESDAGAVGCRRVVVAMSPALAGRLRYEPALPPARDQLTQRVPNGSVVKCMAIYERPFWRERGLSGQAASLSSAARVIFDNSPPSGTPGVLLGFLEARQARELAHAGADARRAAVLDSFARVFGPQALDALEYVEQDWSAEPWTRGCYAGYMPPGVWTGFGEALRAPVGEIHWAGTETAEVWSGYIEGAIRSGRRAASEVLDSF